MTDRADDLRRRLRELRTALGQRVRQIRDEETADDRGGPDQQSTGGPSTAPDSGGPLGGILPDAVRENFLAKILVGMFGIILLSGLIGGFFFIGISDNLNSQVDRQVRATTSLHANAYSNWFANRRDTLEGLAGQDVFSTGEPDEISGELDRARSNSDAIQHYHFINIDTGEIIASSNENAVGENMYDRAFNASVARENTIYDRRYESFGGSLGTTQVIAMIHNVPYVDRILVAQINPENTGPEIEQTTRGAETVVVNRNGEVLFGSESIEGMPAVQSGNVTVEQTDGEILAFEPVSSSANLLVTTRTPKDVAFAVKDGVLRSFGITMLLTFLILIGVTLVGGRSAIRDLNTLVDKAQEMGEGNLEVDLRTDRADEIAVLYQEFDEMRLALDEQITEAENALEQAREARTDAENARTEAEQAKAEAEDLNEHLEAKADEYSDVMQACAAGDFTRRMDPDEESEAMREIATEFNDMIDQIEAVLHQVKTFADEVAGASTEVAAGADDVKSASEKVSISTQEISDGAKEQSQSLQEVNAEMSNLSASIQQAASSSSEVAKTAEQAVNRGEEGREAAETAIDEINHVESQTNKTVQQIETLEEKMAEIGEIVEFITDIAEQTNILALNANIEAARAGEAGSGFAVVANEVKDLAEETQEAAGEIEQVIEDVQEHTETTVSEMEETSEAVTRGVGTVEDALEALEEIVERIEETNRGVQEISQAAEDQAGSTERVVAKIDEVTEISNEVSGKTEDVAAASEEQTASVSEIASSADELRVQSETLQETLATFTVHDAGADIDSEVSNGDGETGEGNGDAADETGEKVEADSGAKTEQADSEAVEDGESEGTDDSASGDDADVTDASMPNGGTDEELDDE